MGTEYTRAEPPPPTQPAFGWWPSPLTAAVVAAGKVSRSGLHSDGTSFLWSESRPDDGGRQVVVVDRGVEPPVDLTPPGVSVRSRVHEYGGGAAVTTADLHVYVDGADQRLYRFRPGVDPAPVALTPDVDPIGSVRYAEPTPTGSGQWLMAVEERLTGTAAIHRLVAVPVDGSLRVVEVVDDGDFLAAPRVSPDGRRLAWVRWDHPDMPWDRSSLWVADLHESDQAPAVTGAHRVAGGGDSSVGQPRWTGDGGLLFIDERTGWWLPYRLPVERLDDTDPLLLPLVELEAEFHAPDWTLGQSTVAEMADGTLVARMHHQGVDRLVQLTAPADGLGSGWHWEPIDQPLVAIAGVAVASASGRLAVLGSTAEEASVVIEVVGGTSFHQLTTARSGTPAPAVLGVPWVAETASGPVPGLIFDPTDDRRGPSGERPPLVVFCHGGPTGATDPGYNPIVQYLASRGLVVACVEYRGSSGYGRHYRQRLRGGWGVADVEDCVAYAVALAETGRVDGRRMAIRGTSAGGLTALGALVDSDRFVGAASWYGVTDLESLAADTHDFESHYLDWLVGPLPAARDQYRRRSPLHHAGSITGGVLLLQGSDDPVVPLAQAERFAEALQASGADCTLLVFAGESHGFRRAETVEASLDAELAFYRGRFGD